MANTGNRNYVTLVNNHYQGVKEVTWPEERIGRSSEALWKVSCKVDNEIKATGEGPTKADAKRAAAKQVYKALFGMD